MQDNTARMGTELTGNQPTEKLPWEEPVVTQFSVTDVTSGASQVPSQVIDGAQYS